MKILSLAVVATLLSFQAAASDYQGSYVCSATGKNLRQQGTTYPVNARLQFSQYQDDQGNRVIKKVIGHLLTSYEEPMLAYAYYGTFQYDSIVANAKYRGRTYKNHSQFSMDATATNDNDGGGIWGKLVVSKNVKDKTFDAHYIFQAGDHMGGTVDFTCQRD
jgi:hypothetical protein